MNAKVKIEAAADEIKEILRKHDIAGAVVLHTPGYAERFVHIDPSYSCGYIEDDYKVFFKMNKAHYKSKADQHQAQTDTANMLNILTEGVGMLFFKLEPLTKEFDELTGAEHFYKP